jgi:hypothetical protein
VEAMMKGARYHEAGHAVAAYHHDVQITGVRATSGEYVTNYRRHTYGAGRIHGANPSSFRPDSSLSNAQYGVRSALRISRSSSRMPRTSAS